jgi:ABC-type transport system substrate-binding protein
MALDRAGQRELAYNVTALSDAGIEVMTQENNIVPASYGSWWLDPVSPDAGDSARFFEHNLDEARKLLDAAGSTGTDVTLQYPSTQYGAVYQLVVENIGNNMSELGLNVVLEGQDYAAVYFPQTRAGFFHGVSVGSAATYAEVGGYVHRYFSDEDSNASRIRDPQIAELRLKQEVEFDVETRRGMIHDIQRVNAEHMYYCPTTYGAGMNYTAYLPVVRNILDPKGPDAPEGYPYLWLDG